ncbi:MAG: UDP-N-acetylmuramoyl-tripeptide--D-alanyl-D-alanine ligase [Pseudomonadota bacterium]
MMRLDQALQWLPGARLVGDGTVQIQRVHSDTRSLSAGDFFVALKGERFDAHAFLPQARAAGAVAALAEHGLEQAGMPGIEVANTRQALAQLAAGWRAQFSLPLIAVTGSNGKTTVTQMIASILRAAHGDRAFATEGNFNNDIGVPLTLLRLRHEHACGVVELGMNHAGEIAVLAALCKPGVALVNNAQREHLEFMESVEAVAAENGSVITALAPDGVAVFPADDDFTGSWRALAGSRRVMTFALDGPADVTGRGQWQGDHWKVSAATPAGPLAFALGVAGQHNVKNALAATACSLAAGVPLGSIATGLASFQPVKGRSRAILLRTPEGELTLIDDTYNANPDSMRAAIDVLAALPAPRLLVLGDMGEVGNKGAEFHAEVGAYAKSRGIEQLLCAGELMAHAAREFNGAVHYGDVESLLPDVLGGMAGQGSVLVKGSRFMRMERVVAALQEQATQTAQAATNKETPCC